ncbi:hypothetical protein FH972_024272 [Carpinus fangiana]|uniref:Uncharacterized protein n=1 Tax=Carpinus fangiana TaxID=176857 RepID=A0A5N6KXW1_9ROSI|nr:hypothetical protein FH972_024272 [Carpinus fangiana]
MRVLQFNPRPINSPLTLRNPWDKIPTPAIPTGLPVSSHLQSAAANNERARNHAPVRRQQDRPAQTGPAGRRCLRQDIAAKCLYKRVCSVTPAASHSQLIADSLATFPPSNIFIDNTHIELSLWDTAGQEEFDRLRSLSYDDTHAIMLCFSVRSPSPCPSVRHPLTPEPTQVDSPESLENVEAKWVGEILENCPGVELVLVALKCDLRPSAGGEDDEDDDTANGAAPGARGKRAMLTYKQGLEVAKRIHALRYLECSAMKNRGVNEAFTEAARVALRVPATGKSAKETKCTVM